MKEAKPKEAMMKTTLYLPEAVWQAFRIRAIEEGTSATKIVEHLIREYVKKPAKKGGSR